MTTEERLDKFEENYNDKDKQFTAFMAKMDMYINKTDQRIARIETQIDNLGLKHEADIKEIRSEGKETRRMIYASIVAQVVGVIAIMVAIALK